MSEIIFPLIFFWNCSQSFLICFWWWKWTHLNFKKEDCWPEFETNTSIYLLNLGLLSLAFMSTGPFPSTMKYVWGGYDYTEAGLGHKAYGGKFSLKRSWVSHSRKSTSWGQTMLWPRFLSEKASNLKMIWIFFWKMPKWIKSNSL